MSSPPDFLGLALGMLRERNARRDQQAQMQRQEQRQDQSDQLEQDRFELQMRRADEARQQEAEKQALAYVQSGGDLKSAEGLWGNDLRESFRPLLKEEAKAFKKREEQQQFGTGAAAELPTLAAQSLRGGDVNPALGRLQTGALGAFGPEEAGPAIGRLMTQFQALRNAQQEKGFASQAKSESEAAEHDRRARVSAGIEIGKQRTLAGDERQFKDYSIRDKETGEYRTVIGFDNARRLVEEHPEKFVIANRPSTVGPEDSGTFGGKERTKVAKIEDVVSARDKALTRSQRLRTMMDTNPELFGAAGGALTAVRGVFGTVSDTSKMPIRSIRDSGVVKALEGLRREYAEELTAMRRSEQIAPEAYHYFSKVFRSANPGAVDVLSGMQVFDAARLMDPSGRISNEDREQAAESVGVRGYAPTLSQDRVIQRQDEFISQLESDLDFEMSRLEKLAASGNATTIRREDLRSQRGAQIGVIRSEPGVTLTPEQKQLVDSILGADR